MNNRRAAMNNRAGATPSKGMSAAMDSDVETLGEVPGMNPWMGQMGMGMMPFFPGMGQMGMGMGQGMPMGQGMGQMGQANPASLRPNPAAQQMVFGTPAKGGGRKQSTPMTPMTPMMPGTPMGGMPGTPMQGMGGMGPGGMMMPMYNPYLYQYMPMMGMQQAPQQIDGGDIDDMEESEMEETGANTPFLDLDPEPVDLTASEEESPLSPNAKRPRTATATARITPASTPFLDSLASAPPLDNLPKGRKPRSTVRKPMGVSQSAMKPVRPSVTAPANRTLTPTKYRRPVAPEMAALQVTHDSDLDIIELTPNPATWESPPKKTGQKRSLPTAFPPPPLATPRTIPIVLTNTKKPQFPKLPRLPLPKTPAKKTKKPKDPKDEFKAPANYKQPPPTPSRVSSRAAKATLRDRLRAAATRNEVEGRPGIDVEETDVTPEQLRLLDLYYEVEAEVETGGGKARGKGLPAAAARRRRNPFYCTVCQRIAHNPHDHVARHVHMLPFRCPLPSCGHRTLIAAEFEQHVKRRHEDKAAKVERIRRKEALRKYFPYYMKGDKCRFAETALCQLCCTGEALEKGEQRSHVLHEHFKTAMWLCPVEGCTYKGSYENQKPVQRHINGKHKNEGPNLKPVSEGHKYAEDIEALRIQCFTVEMDPDDDFVDTAASSESSNSDSSSDEDESSSKTRTKRRLRKRVKAAPIEKSDESDSSSVSDTSDTDASFRSDEDDDEETKDDEAPKWSEVVRQARSGKDKSDSDRRRRRLLRKFGKGSKSSPALLDLDVDDPRMRSREGYFPKRRIGNAPSASELKELERDRARALARNGRWNPSPAWRPERGTGPDVEASDDDETGAHSLRINSKLLARNLRMQEDLVNGSLVVDGPLASWQSRSDTFDDEDAPKKRSSTNNGGDCSDVEDDTEPWAAELLGKRTHLSETKCVTCEKALYWGENIYVHIQRVHIRRDKLSSCGLCGESWPFWHPRVLEHMAAHKEEVEVFGTAMEGVLFSFNWKVEKDVLFAWKRAFPDKPFSLSESASEKGKFITPAMKKRCKALGGPDSAPPSLSSWFQQRRLGLEGKPGKRKAWEEKAGKTQLPPEVVTLDEEPKPKRARRPRKESRKEVAASIRRLLSDLTRDTQKAVVEREVGDLMDSLLHQVEVKEDVDSLLSSLVSDAAFQSDAAAVLTDIVSSVEATEAMEAAVKAELAAKLESDLPLLKTEPLETEKGPVMEKEPVTVLPKTEPMEEELAGLGWEEEVVEGKGLEALTEEEEDVILGSGFLGGLVPYSPSPPASPIPEENEAVIAPGIADVPIRDDVRDIFREVLDIFDLVDSGELSLDDDEQ